MATIDLTGDLAQGVVDDLDADLGGDLGADLGELEPATPPLFDEQGRVRLSFSRIDTYRTCPAKFRYAYVDALPGEPAPALSFGTSLHGALERFYDQKLPACPSVEDLLSYLYDAWESDGFAQMPREEQLHWYRHAQDVLRRFHARALREYRLPADVEKFFELPFGDDAVVTGRIDRVDVLDDGALEVVDYKTNKKVKDREAVRSSLQLALYALACEHLYGQLPAAVTLDFIVVGLRVRVPTDEIDFERARDAVSAAAAAVRAGAYEPTPSALCGWCDYRGACPAWQGEGPDVLGTAIEQLERLRRRLRREVRTLRDLESGVTRLRAEVEARGESARTLPLVRAGDGGVPTVVDVDLPQPVA